MSTVEDFQVFLDVVETGNITHSSQRLHMSQPSVSIHIQNLEKEYGTQFFNRTNRGVTLTRSGEIFYDYVSQICTLLDEANKEIKKLNATRKEIQIGATFTIGEYLVPYLIREYYQQENNSIIEIKIADTDMLARHIDERKLNIALIEGPIPPNANFRLETFWHDELKVVVPVDNPLSQKDYVSFEDLTREKIISREQGSGTRRFTEVALSNNGFDIKNLNIHMELGSTQAIKRALLCNMGIAIISELTVQEEIKFNQVKALRLKECALKRPLNILTYANADLSQEEKSFITLLRDKELLKEALPAIAN